MPSSNINSLKYTVQYVWKMQYKDELEKGPEIKLVQKVLTVWYDNFPLYVWNIQVGKYI